MAITTAASQNYAFVETLTYTLRCNYVYSEPPISPIPGQPAEGVGDDPRYPNGRVEDKTITWTIGSNSEFTYGEFLDGSPWVQDNGDLHLINVDPTPTTAKNAWYEDFNINQTVLNPDFGKTFSQMVGAQAWGIGDINNWDSSYSANMNYSGGGAGSFTFRCIPDDRGDSGYNGTENYRLYSSQYIPTSNRNPFQQDGESENRQYGNGTDSHLYPQPFDGRGYLTAGEASEPREWSGPCSITNLEDVLVEGADPEFVGDCEALLPGVASEDQDWVKNWPARMNWEYGAFQSFSGDDPDGNAVSGFEVSPTSGQWDLPAGEVDEYPLGKKFYGNSRGIVPSEGHEQMVRDTGPYTDRDGVVRWSGIWDGSEEASTLKAYDLVASAISHYDTGILETSRGMYRDRYAEAIDPTNPHYNEDNPQLAYDGEFWAKPAGRAEKGLWGHQDGGDRYPYMDLYASLLVVPDPKQLPNWTDEDGVVHSGFPENADSYSSCFRPPVNWDPTDRMNIPFMTEPLDIDSYTFDGGNTLRGQVGYPTVGMDSEINGTPQPDQNWILRTIDGSAGEPDIPVYQTLANWVYPLSKPAVNSPGTEPYNLYDNVNYPNAAYLRMGSHRVWLGACHQDPKVQGFQSSLSLTTSEYGGTMANIFEVLVALGYDRNLSSEELEWHANNLNVGNYDGGFQEALKYLYDVYVADLPDDYDLRKACRRAAAQQGIDEVGGMMSLGKFNQPNAGHTDPYDWMVLQAYLCTQDKRIEYVLKGNIGSGRNDTRKFGAGDNFCQDAIDFFGVRDGPEPMYGTFINRLNSLGPNGSELMSISNTDSWGVNRFYHNARFENLTVTKVDAYVWEAGIKSPAQNDDTVVTFPNIKISVAPPHATNCDANYTDNIMSMIRAFNVQERQYQENGDPSTQPMCGLRTDGSNNPLIIYPTDPPYVDGYDRQLAGELTGESLETPLEYKEGVCQYVPDDDIISVNGQKFNYWGGRDGDRNFYELGDVVGDEVCGVDFDPSVKNNWYYPHDRLYWTQRDLNLVQFGKYNPADEEAGCDLQCKGHLLEWARNSNDATSDLASGSLYWDTIRAYKQPGQFSRSSPIWGNGDNLGNFRPGRFKGMYIYNTRNKKLSRVVNNGVDHNYLHECALSQPDPVSVQTNNQNQSTTYEVFEETPSYRSLYLVLQEDIDCQPGDKIHLFPATVTDIEARDANFGSINTVVGLAGVAGEVNYGFVYHRGILACGMGARILNNLVDTDGKLMNKIEAAKAFPKFFEDIYISRASLYANAVNRSGVDDYASGNYFSVGTLNGNATGGGDNWGMLWRALIADQVVRRTGASVAEYDGNDANRIEAEGEFLAVGNQYPGYGVGEAFPSKKTWPAIRQDATEYVPYCHNPPNVTGILTSGNIVLFTGSNGSGFDQEDGQSISVSVNDLDTTEEKVGPGSEMDVMKTIIGKRVEQQGQTLVDLDWEIAQTSMSAEEYANYRTSEGIVIVSGNGADAPSNINRLANRQGKLRADGTGTSSANKDYTGKVQTSKVPETSELNAVGYTGHVLPYENYVEGKDLYCWLKGTNRPIKMVKLGEIVNNDTNDDKVTLNLSSGDVENSIHWTQVWVLPDTYDDGSSLKFWPNLMGNLPSKFLDYVTFFYADSEGAS